jgi:hypothetical protein
MEGTQTPCQGSKCAKTGTTQSGKHMGIWGGGLVDGAGKQEMEGEMCTENDKEGRGWERQWQQRLQRCRMWPCMARHVQRIALVLWLSGQHWNRLCNAAELGRGDEVNRQVEVAISTNPTESRDSLQILGAPWRGGWLVVITRQVLICALQRASTWPLTAITYGLPGTFFVQIQPLPS